MPDMRFTRRETLLSSAALVTAAALPQGDASAAPAPAKALKEALDITLRVNGKPYALTVDAETSLLDALRERIGLTGSKKGCGLGQCGACTVLVDGRRINSCLTLAVMQQGKKITTIEGLAQGDRLHPVQEAFVEHDGFQCGYCTPGQIMSAAGLLGEGRDLTDETIREFMSGNLCRCGAYTNIVEAIKDASRKVPQNAAIRL